MEVEIFDVEHGGCALVTADTGARMLIDCGYNASTGWRPSTHLPNDGISAVEIFAVTNYDEDHVNDLTNLRTNNNNGQTNVRLRSLLRNKSVTSNALREIKKEGGMGNGIRELTKMIDSYTGGPLEVNWGELSYKVFCNNYPNDFTDPNNLSLAIFIQSNGLNIVFPGDLEKAGWLKLLENSAFVEQLETVDVFVASHHGRENGCCDEVFEIISPEIAIFSDAGMQYNTQETATWYRNRTRGINYNGRQRHVFTTRRDGKITLRATSDSTDIYTAI